MMDEGRREHNTGLRKGFPFHKEEKDVRKFTSTEEMKNKAL